ncbi:MAG: efflux RND transporter periplasmic adaptor subunit [Fuerstiella sp.]
MNSQHSDKTTVMSRWRIVLPRQRIVLTATAFASMFAVLLLTGAVDRNVAPVDIGLEEIQPSQFLVNVQQRGVVEPMSSKAVHSSCYWSTNILSIVPEGTWVQAGDVVCVLDAAEIEDFKRSREVILIKYRGRLDGAVQDEQLLAAQNDRRLTAAEFKVQSSELQLHEYSDGTLPQLLEEMEQDLAVLADQSDAAGDEIRHIEKMWAMGLTSRQGLDRGTLDLIDANEKHRQLESKLNLLTKFTQPRTQINLEHRHTEAVRTLVRVKMSNGLARTRARLTTLSYERTLRIYERYYRRAVESIEACTLRAPCDGQVMYGNSWYLMSRGITQVAEGARIRNLQKVFEIPDQEHLKVSVPLIESLIYRVHEGMNVDVVLAGYEDVTIAGKIAKIPRYPRSRSSSTPDLKDYWLDVELLPTEQQRSLIKMKADASVTIAVTDIPDALQVPRHAVTGVAGENFLYVFNGKELVPRKVDLGEANDEYVCVVSGLSAGEKLVTDMTPQHKAALEATLAASLAADN